MTWAWVPTRVPQRLVVSLARTHSPLPGTACGSSKPSCHCVVLELLAARANDVATHTSPCWPVGERVEQRARAEQGAAEREAMSYTLNVRADAAAHCMAAALHDASRPAHLRPQAGTAIWCIGIEAQGAPPFIGHADGHSPPLPSPPPPVSPSTGTSSCRPSVAPPSVAWSVTVAVAMAVARKAKRTSFWRPPPASKETVVVADAPVSDSGLEPGSCAAAQGSVRRQAVERVDASKGRTSSHY